MAEPNETTHGDPSAFAKHRGRLRHLPNTDVDALIEEMRKPSIAQIQRIRITPRSDPITPDYVMRAKRAGRP
jgi:hypothetical protein